MYHQAGVVAVATMALLQTAYVVSGKQLSRDILRFEDRRYAFDIYHGAPPGTPVVPITARDIRARKDRGPNDVIIYYLNSSSSAVIPFEIDRVSGVISTTTTIDQPIGFAWTLTVWARLQERTFRRQIRIAASVRNIAPPSFLQGEYNFTVVHNPNDEGHVPILVAHLLASDGDGGTRVKYGILPGSNSRYFRLRQSGELMMLDYPAMHDIRLVAVATDYGSPRLNSTVVVHVDIKDLPVYMPTWAIAIIVITILITSVGGSMVFIVWRYQHRQSMKTGDKSRLIRKPDQASIHDNGSW